MNRDKVGSFHFCRSLANPGLVYAKDLYHNDVERISITMSASQQQVISLTLLNGTTIVASRRVGGVWLCSKRNNEPKKKKRKRPANSAPILSIDFDAAEFDRFWEALKAEARKVPSEQDGHVSILGILEDPKIYALIFSIFRLIKLSQKNGIGITYQAISKIFEAAGIDISIFRDDMEEQFRKLQLNQFLKMNVVYTFRSKQTCCAKCARLIIDFMFGGIGYESNHYADDNAESDEERSKWFDISGKNFGRKLEDILFELCKTRLECWRCHNRFGPNQYGETTISLSDHFVLHKTQKKDKTLRVASGT